MPYLFFWLIGQLILAYMFATAAFLVMRRFMDKVRIRTSDFLNVANGIAVPLLVINFAWTIQSVVTCDYCYGYLFYLSAFANFLLAFLIHLLFLKRKFRERISLTILSLALLLVYENFDRLLILVTSMYRDYLPSTWMTYYHPDKLVETALFSLLYFIVCWVIAGRRMDRLQVVQ